MRDVMWEVFVLRQVQHTHICRLCDSIEFTDAVYVVMERYEGPSLQQHIHSQPTGTLTDVNACRFFCHLLAALRHAHSRGFLHCDVKPENVRLNAACDTAVLVDFGMARALLQHGGADGIGSIARGTPAYASPEQLTGHNPEQAFGEAELEPAADVWSLGATLFEMVHGHVPFGGESFEALVTNVMQLRFATAATPAVPSAEASRVVGATLQILPSDRLTIAQLCEDDWVARSGQLPPAVPLPRIMVSGKGFQERADIDGVTARPARGRTRTGSTSAAPLDVRSLLGFDPKQWGVTPLAIALGVPASGQSFVLGEFAQRVLSQQKTVLLRVVYAVLLAAALLKCVQQDVSGGLEFRLDSMMPATYSLVEEQ